MADGPPKSALLDQLRVWRRERTVSVSVALMSSALLSLANWSCAALASMRSFDSNACCSRQQSAVCCSCANDKNKNNNDTNDKKNTKIGMYIAGFGFA